MGLIRGVYNIPLWNVTGDTINSTDMGEQHQNVKMLTLPLPTKFYRLRKGIFTRINVLTNVTQHRCITQ